MPKIGSSGKSDLLTIGFSGWSGAVRTTAVAGGQIFVMEITRNSFVGLQPGVYFTTNNCTGPAYIVTYAPDPILPISAIENGTLYIEDLSKPAQRMVMLSIRWANSPCKQISLGDYNVRPTIVIPNIMAQFMPPFTVKLSPVPIDK
jgi:hypothetical protein